MEEWKEISWTGGKYMVSNLGRVSSIDQAIIRSNGRKYTMKRKILKPAVDKCGYERVALSMEGKLITKKVHRLVALEFCKKRGGEVNHIDGNKRNNCASNLEWCTRSENMIHSYKNGTSVPRRGSQNKSAKITTMQAMTIKTMLGAGIGPAKISREMGISNHITKDISRNRTWTHL